ncbi:MAG: type VI secretion system Vgr family protein [Rhizobiaceae bacterium]
MAADRSAVARTPAGDSLIFTRLEGRDEVSSCFSYTISFVSTDIGIDPMKMLGQVISIEGEGEPKRWFSGLCSDFRLTRIEEELARYEAIVRPWLWFLSNTTDCRIFQKKTVIEIVEEIFSKYPDAKFEKRLQSSYPEREYCVQYDESDLNFVQRLLEHEGIMYFFEHGDATHTLVLTDAMSKLKPAPGYETVEFNFGGLGNRRDKEYIVEWAYLVSVQSGAYVHTDFDFKKPGADLMAQSTQPFSHKEAAGEQYHQPGAHLDSGRGETIASIRRQELQAPHKRISAVGHARGLFPGCTFKLESFPRDDQNQEYMVVSAQYRMFDPGFIAGIEAPEGESYTVVLGVAPTSITYRPPRVTPRPVMRGPQTATVVGPSGQEIFTDEYARVKVQFHWDRLGKRDQNSSCFVRVSQTWAGSGWGFIQIPRIGQEVIVEFVEGDPDRPIITGRVYNASQMPPYSLPGSATMSGWKSNSSLGGGGWNELRFEDKAGAEEVYFQAQKDHKLLIKNDRDKLVQHDQSDRIDNNAKHSVGVNLDEDVGNNKTLLVGNNRTGTIGNNDTETVGGNRSLTVAKNETIAVMMNSTETIGINQTQTIGAVQTITIGAARIASVGASETQTVGASQAITVGASREVTVGSNQTHNVGGSDTVSVGKDQTINIGANQSFAVAEARSIQIGKDDATTIGGAHAMKVAKASAVNVGEDASLTVGKNYVLEAKDSITLKCGSASISMKKDGTITIKGKDISVSGSGKINIKASSDVIIKGSKIHEN